MSIVYTPEKYLSNVDQKSDVIKVCESSVKSSSTLFSCSIHAIYGRGNRAQTQHLFLNPYIPGIHYLMIIKIHYDNIFSGKLVNELHAWI